MEELLKWYCLIGLIFYSISFIFGIYYEDDFLTISQNSFFIWLIWPFFIIMVIFIIGTILVNKIRIIK